MVGTIELNYNIRGGIEIGDLDLANQQRILEASCESDSFYGNSRVVTYMDSGRERHVIVVTVEEAVALVQKLVEDPSNTDVRHLTVPAYCHETFGSSPERTRREAEAFEAEIGLALAVQRGETADMALSQDVG